MSQKKPKSRKKGVKTAKSPVFDEELDETLINDEFEEFQPKRSSSRLKLSSSDQFEDDMMEDQPENVDLLDTIDGLDYDSDQFQEDFPHLSKEIQNPHLLYPVDAVSWDDEEPLEEEAKEEEVKPKKGRFTPLEEPTLKSLLSRSRTEEEALEIIKYFEKREEISSSEADKLISTLRSKGLKAFKGKKED